MTTRPAIGRLDFYSVPHGAETTEAGLYVCIAVGCREIAVYREPDPDMILVWCETHTDPAKIDAYEYLGHAVNTRERPRSPEMSVEVDGPMDGRRTGRRGRPRD